MRNVLTKVAIAAAMLMGVASAANAFAVLTMRDVSTATVKTCNTFTLVGCGSGSGFTVISPNFVNFSGSIGAFDVASTQGLNNAPGTTVATSNTTSLTVNRNDVASGIKTLVVDFISFDFFNPTGIWKTMQGSASTTAPASFFNSTTESIITDFRVDSNNGFGGFAFGPTVSGAACSMATALSNNCNSALIVWNDPALGVAGFSTRTQQAFRIEASSIINTTSSLVIRNVPEPMTLSMVGAALLGLGFASRRRRSAIKA